jgi:hypothetical protein
MEKILSDTIICRRSASAADEDGMGRRGSAVHVHANAPYGTFHSISLGVQRYRFSGREGRVMEITVLGETAEPCLQSKAHLQSSSLWNLVRTLTTCYVSIFKGP